MWLNQGPQKTLNTCKFKVKLYYNWACTNSSIILAIFVKPYIFQFLSILVATTQTYNMGEGSEFLKSIIYFILFF